MIELVEMADEDALEHHAEGADDDRREEERPPIADTDEIEHEIGTEGAQHVLRAMREVDDVEHAEDDGEPEAQHRVESAIDEADQELRHQRRQRRDGEMQRTQHGSRRPLAPTLSPAGRGG